MCSPSTVCRPRASRSAAWHSNTRPDDVRDRIHLGDLLDLDLPTDYDLVFGLDIFEHLNPNRLDKYLAAIHERLVDGGVLFAVVPAFGTDAVFGEAFPLYLDEWQADLDARPFVRTRVLRSRRISTARAPDQRVNRMVAGAFRSGGIPTASRARTTGARALRGALRSRTRAPVVLHLHFSIGIWSSVTHAEGSSSFHSR